MERMMAGAVRERESTPLSLLLVEDSDRDAILLRNLIQRSPLLQNAEVVHTACLAEAQEWLSSSRNHPDCVLLDLGLPDAGGLSGLRTLQTGYVDVPVVMLTGLDDDTSGSAELRQGAQGCLVKDHIGSGELAHAILRAIARQQKRTSAQFPQRLDSIWFRDGGTGLPNHRMFEEHMGMRLRLAAETNPVLIGLLDLNGFGLINEREGRAIGDAILKIVGRRLQYCLCFDDLVARLNGDQFGLVVNSVLATADESMLVDRLRRAVRNPIRVGTEEYALDAGIGLVRCPSEGSDRSELLTLAGSRMRADQVARCA